MKNIRIWAAIAVLLAAGCSEKAVSSAQQVSKFNASSFKPSVSVSSDEPELTPVPLTLQTVEISFDTKRMATEASNQFAVWVEDESGALVKTIYVSDFTGRRRGYTRRPDALCHWTAVADPKSISDDVMDTISGATFDDGSHQLTWDLTDQNGVRVEDGTYTVYVEGTLYWTSNVLYSAQVHTIERNDVLSVQEVRSEPDNQKNADMISNVKMETIYD